jgi:outer membrane lipopolysaccharide assembly protein LptE/RlpB
MASARLRLAARGSRSLRETRPLLALMAALCAGCGYTWQGAASGGVPLGRIAVRTPENTSSQPGLEFVVADALRREVMRRAGAKLVEDADSADWVVSGRVLPLRIAPASLSPVVLTLEYQLTLEVDLHARAPDGREIKGESRSLSETERFLSSADVEAQRKNREEALRRVSRVLAARFLDRLDEERGG